MIKTGMNNKQMKQISLANSRSGSAAMMSKRKRNKGTVAAEDQARDSAENRSIGLKKKSVKKAIKTSGDFDGKSNRLGQGGRAAQMRAQGVPGGVIGERARAAQAAPGQKNFHKKKK